MATMTESTTRPTTTSRRSFTLPSRLQTTAGDPTETDATGAETLFAHSAARVVSFSASKIIGLGTGKQDANPLPWASRSERVISLGPLRIYRLRGSVSFLHAGSLLLSLLPRSQCWCVDGESKFAMRIQHLIYRIELPFGTEQEKAQVEELKDVLGRILLYEKTACPFRRGFTVDLPEEQDSPPRRRTLGPLPKAKKWEMRDIWRREGENFRPTALEVNSPVEEDDEEDETLENDNQMDVLAEERNVERAEEQPEQDPFREDDTKPPIRPRALKNMSSTASVQLSVRSIVEHEVVMQQELSHAFTEYDRLIPPSAATALDMSSQSELDHVRLASPSKTTLDQVSISDLPHPSLDAPQTTISTNTVLDVTQEAELSVPSADRSRASSIRSYYTSLELQPGSLVSPISEYGDPFDVSSPYIHTSTTPSAEPTDDPDDSELTTTSSTSQDTLSSDTTLSPPPQPGSQSTKTASAIYVDNRTPTLEYNSYNFPTRRPRTSTSSSAPDPRRAFSNPNRADRSTGTNVTSAFVSRTAALFLGPPSGLVSAMMQIASRLANGALSTASSSAAGGAAYRFNLEGLPGRWEDSEEEREHEHEDDEFAGHEPSYNTTSRNEIEDDEYDDLEEVDDNGLDDFGVPLGNDTPARNGRKNWGWVKTPVSSPQAKQTKRGGNDLKESENEQVLSSIQLGQQQTRDVVIEND